MLEAIGNVEAVLQSGLGVEDVLAALQYPSHGREEAVGSSAAAAAPAAPPAVFHCTQCGTVTSAPGPCGASDCIRRHRAYVMAEAAQRRLEAAKPP